MVVKRALINKLRNIVINRRFAGTNTNKMKKIFSFLLLGLLCSIGTTWAVVNTSLIDGITLPSTPTGTYVGGTIVVHNGTNNAVVVDANGNGVMQAVAPGYGTRIEDNFTWANAANGETDASWSTTGTTWVAPDNSLFVGSTAYTTEGNAHYVNFARRGNLRNNRTFAYRFTNCGGVSALVKSQGTNDNAAAVLAVYKVSGNDLIAAGSVSSKTAAVDIITVDGLLSSETYVAFVYGMNGSNGELYEMAFLASTTDPAINANSEASISATESGVEVTEVIDVTGQNLTGSTLTATLNPAVAGLSVTLASNAISAGTISTTATLHYIQTENAKGSTTLILSDGTTSKNITINYASSVMNWTLQSVSEAKTWDFATLSGGIQYVDEDLSVEHVYANIPEITCPNGFDGTALAFTGEYPLRSGKAVAQNGTLRFHTTVPGNIVVKFSDTGTGASATAVKRYLVVNGETTSYWASRENTGDEPYPAQLNVITDPIAVPAGDVTISGTSALVYSIVTFTPTAEVISTYKEYVTYVTKNALDFTGVAGLTAYVATDAVGDAVSLTAVETVPAGTPLVLHGADMGEFVVPMIASAVAPAVNRLVAGTGDAVSGADKYVLSIQNEAYVFASLSAETVYVPEGKAYLDLTGMNAAPALRIVEGENHATNIEQLDRSEKVVKFIENGNLFFLRDGVVYDATGRVVR